MALTTGDLILTEEAAVASNDANKSGLPMEANCIKILGGCAGEELKEAAAVDVGGLCNFLLGSC